MLEEQDKTMYDADIDDEIAREERESGVADSNVHHQPRDAASCMTKSSRFFLSCIAGRRISATRAATRRIGPKSGGLGPKSGLNYIVVLFCAFHYVCVFDEVV